MVAFTPDYFATVDRSKFIEAELQRLGQFLDGKSNFDASTESGKVQHCAIKRGLTVKEDFPGMMNFRSLESPVFHFASSQSRAPQLLELRQAK